MSTKLFILDRGQETLPETLADRLPSWRRERFNRLKNPAARQESLCAGLLYRYVMARCGADPDAPVELLPAGKPVLSGRDDLFFSLSHSGRYVLCAVSEKTVGADVQELRPVRLTVARRFHPAEQTWLAALPEAEKADGLYRVWTRKEAWVKAVSAERWLELAETDVLHGVPGLSFWDCALPGSYRAALCGAEGSEPETVFLGPEEIKE